MTVKAVFTTEVSVLPGTTIDEACTAAVELAEKLGTYIRFYFNGRSILARAEDTPEELEDRWKQRECTQTQQPRCSRTLHHRGGIFHCLREKGHEPDGHHFELPDVDTRIEEDA